MGWEIPAAHPDAARRTKKRMSVMERGPQQRTALLPLAVSVLASAALVLSVCGRGSVEAGAALFGPPTLEPAKPLGRAKPSPAAVQRLPAPEVHQSPQRLPPIAAQQPLRPSRLPSVTSQPKNDPLSEPGQVVIDGVSRRVASLSRRAYQLADRGALYSARANFIQALRMVTQALDAQTGTLRHGRALAAGMQAMKEADDFVPRGTSLEADLDVPVIIAGHRTTILKQDQPVQLTPLAALRQYFAYAQQQFTIAGGSQQAASMALHGFGKVQTAIAAGDRSQLAAVGAKAIVLQRAALAVDRQNYLAANELGVLLARYGQFAEARQALLHSVSLAPRATTWHNLAVVHHKLNEADLAERAEFESQSAARQSAPAGTAGTSSNVAAVRWVSPQAFAGNRPVETRRPSVVATAQPAERHAKWWESMIPWK